MKVTEADFLPETDTFIWLPQPGETPKAYTAFEAYLNLVGERSIDRAFIKHWRDKNPHSTKPEPKVASGHWGQWSVDYNWGERVKAFEKHLAQRSNDEFENAIVSRRQQTLRSALSDADRLLKAWEKRIADADYYDVKTLNALVRTRLGIDDLHRRALGMPTTQTDVTSGGQPIASTPIIQFIWTDENDNGGHEDSSN